ncbi:hypothetical protein GIB67_014625 [Kingdonia uniflora]|uniref:CCHC-type domain-containing protein n=1 Tax=Kingdonia uniflora TaxID=39325 RepID=A0A7J7NV12_9MAGN|nr:hypothetical protein GIB67_014625 [Kingdonia uniflora]
MPQSCEGFIIVVFNSSRKEDIKFDITISLIMSEENMHKSSELSSGSNDGVLNVEERVRSYIKRLKNGRGCSQSRGKSKSPGASWTCGKNGHFRRDCNSFKKDNEEKYTMNLTENVSYDEAQFLLCNDVNESWIVDSGALFHANANIGFLTNIVKYDFGTVFFEDKSVKPHTYPKLGVQGGDNMVQWGLIVTATPLMIDTTFASSTLGRAGFNRSQTVVLPPVEIKTGVQKSTDFIAVVPFKKRKLPLFNPPSPPPSSHVEPDVPKKDTSKSNLESCSSNACSPTEVSKIEKKNHNEDKGECFSDRHNRDVHLKRRSPPQSQTPLPPPVVSVLQKVEIINSNTVSSSNVCIPAEVSQTQSTEKVLLHGEVGERDSDGSVSLKRTSPFVGPLSLPPPPPQPQPRYPSSSHFERDLLKKELFDSKPTSSNVCDYTSIPRNEKSDKASSQDENGDRYSGGDNNLVKNNVTLSGINLLDPTCSIASASGSIIGSSEKIGLADKSAFQIVRGNTELGLASGESCMPKIEKEFTADTEIVKNDKSDTSEMQVNSKLLSAPKEPSGQDLLGHTSGGVTAEDEKLDPCSWNLGLTRTQMSTSNKVNCSNQVNICTDANRSLWDLNTTMDTWEGSMSRSGIVHGAGNVDGLECDMNSAVSVKELPETCNGRNNLLTLFAPCDQQNKAEDLLNLKLTTSSGLESGSTQKLPCSSAKTDSRRALAGSSFHGKVVSTSNSLNLVDQKIIKSEPSDMGKLLNGRIIKSEPFESHLHELNKSCSASNLKSVGHANVKSEPFCRVNQDNSKLVEATQKKSEHHSCIVEMPIRDPMSHCLYAGIGASPLILGVSSSSLFPTTTGLSGSELSPCIENVHQQASEVLVSDSVGPGDKEPKVSSVEGLGSAAGSSRSKLTSNVNPDACTSTDIAGNDEAKINIFDDMQDESSSVTEDECEGNRAISGVMDTEGKHRGGADDDYEDGEVREPVVHSLPEEGKPAVFADPSINTIMDSVAIPLTNLPHAEGKDTIMKDLTEKGENETVMKDLTEKKEEGSPSGSAQWDNISLSVKYDESINSLSCSQEKLTLELPVADTGKNILVRNDERIPVDHNGSEDNLERELESDGVPCTMATQETDLGHCKRDTSNQRESTERNNPIEALPKAEPPGSSAEATNPVKNGVNQRRIINLPRAFNGSSHDKVKPIPIRNEKGKFINGVAQNGDKFNPRGRGSRDDSSMDVKYKCGRQKNHDQPGGSNGTGFVHGRRRVDNRLDSPRGDWNTDREFAPENYNGITGTRFPGQRGGFIVSRGAGRGRGRKPTNNELPGYRHPHSRRRSPVNGLQMVRRPPRDISPTNRCINEEKFTRALSNEMVDPMFSRPQPQFQRLDDPFVRRERSFSPIQRRGPPRIPQVRSKSPPGSRTRSPGSWSSPRRRSPDGFGRQELINHRSPQFYRIDKMRSQQQQQQQQQQQHHHPCFTDEMVDNRHSSPPYIREIGSPRDHDRPRKFVPNRSPSIRILPRSTRRFEMTDLREEADDDEYFGGPMPSGQFHDLGGNTAPDDRRVCGEKQGPARTFRPPFNGGDDIENFRFHVEDAPRYRICPENATEFQERVNLREREFERRIKVRPGNPPGRTRNIEEQEENYRHDEQGWQDNGFEDVSRPKRRRF